jgi:FAD/FMN-containing dehydrogenase
LLDLGQARHGAAQTRSPAVVKDSVALDMIGGLKRMLDPKGILNPGKVL